MRGIWFKVIVLWFIGTIMASRIWAVEQTNYCYIPPGISVASSVSPLVQLVIGRDHKFYYEAYNDASDLDDDGIIDVGYKHSITYYGYFDPYKCYSYEGSGANAKFVPKAVTINKYCDQVDGEWSGNFLNWLSMSRIDILKKVLYGGERLTDSASETVLQGAYIPQDAHSWGKEYSGDDTPKLTPFSKPGSGRRHLFCITSTSKYDAHKIRVAKNDTNRIWDWASTERAVCSGPDTPGDYRRGPVGTRSDIEDYYVRVKVCDSKVGLESNCKAYHDDKGNTVYKPIGLLQRYGEGDGSKWCSKSLKSCNTNSDCNISNDGLCVYKGRMYFGLLSGSYTKNLSGGVLRKNIWSIQDETNAQTGIFQSSENVEGNIILTIDRMKVIGFQYSDYSYQDSDGGTCGWLTQALQEGQCRMWGNPIAEMMYEALRYLVGKGSPTSPFTYSGTQDSGLNLSKPDWGIKQGNTYYQTTQLFPWCAKRFMLVISDINNSYDSDSVPGSFFSSFSGDLPNLNVSTIANTISSQENIRGSKFIGQVETNTDFLCTPKNVSTLSKIRGICPEEPTKQGSYYPASIAYYGNIIAKDNTGLGSDVKTYAVALASPLPDIAIKVGDQTVRIVPVGKSFSGCLNVYNACASKCNLTSGSNGLRVISCSSDAFCPTNQIVDFYIDTIIYDSSNNITNLRLRVNFEDVEQGADHDMDAIIFYEITPQGSNQVKVKVTSEYAAGCIDQVLGFNISGTTEDGTYLVVKDKDVGGADGDTPSAVSNLPLTWEKVFTISSNVAEQIKEPLWYAAKWGGFDDRNGNNLPDLQSEWDRDRDGIPDTYFKVTNPLRLEEQLEKAFLDILGRISSGTTVVALPPTSTTEASIMARTYFYPEKTAGIQKMRWIGELSSLWFDPNSLMRENTDNYGESNVMKIMDVKKDYPVSFIFSSTDNAYVAWIYNDLDNTGNPRSCTHTSKHIEDIAPVFSSGSLLMQKDPDSRNIKTWLDTNSNEIVESSEVISFDPNNSSLRNILKNYWSYGDALGTCDENCAQSVMKYVRGYDRPTPSGSTFRLRQQNETGNDIRTAWKLADTVYSTPRIVTNKAVNGYDIRYGDVTYGEFIDEKIKNQKAIIVLGSNDGMIHAFRLGRVEDILPPTQNNEGKQVAKVTDTETIGEEIWAFIPQNVIPYLRWYCQENYCHIPMIETTFTVLDASIGAPENPYQPNNNKSKDSWRRLLIAQMGFGGTEITVGGKTFSSSIIVLDITNPLDPKLLWEKQLPDRSLTFGTPGIVRLGESDKNGAWYLVIGSGPVSLTTTSITYPQQPKIYVFNLKTGEVTATLSIPNASNVAVGDFLSTDLDLPKGDYQTDNLYFGTYNNSTGALYRLRIRNSENYITTPSQWQISMVINAGRPVFAAPEVTHDENNIRWLYFGTGIYINNLHTAPTNEKFFGIIETDNCWKGTSVCNAISEGTDLIDTTNLRFTSATAWKYSCQCPGSITLRTGNCRYDANNNWICGPCEPGESLIITEVKLATLTGATASLASCNAKKDMEAIQCIESLIYTYNANSGQFTFYRRGWMLTLSNEKVYSSPRIVGGAVLATPFKPSADPCSVGGSTNLLALYYKTGTPYPQPIIRAVGGTSYSTLTNVTIGMDIEIAKGPPPVKESIVIRVQEDGTTSAFTQTSGGITKIEIRQPSLAKDMFIHWLAK
ncbi:MAG: PilC/PilY family type IV pilus protein [Syntrophobacterales bacterium]|nr:PilC/PilY family type IV pilus protein [Syntrophobacterales bacterium]